MFQETQEAAKSASGFSPISAATTAGSGIIGSLISTRANKKAQERQNKYNREERDRQNAWNLEQWNRENLYNSPQEQMRRFKEGGLNPNLIYGQGTAGNSATTPVRSERANADVGRTYEDIDLPSMMSMYQDMEIKKVTTDNLKKQGNNATYS